LASDPANGAGEEFSSNAVRLSGTQWAIALCLVVAIVLLLPWAQQRGERFEPSGDYRIPYQSSEDYYLYAKYARYASWRYPAAVIGDSVVWGHYVAPNATLPHFLNQEAGAALFANLGLDGIRQVAVAGLMRYYAKDIAKQGVMLHLNPLWMSSPEADMCEPGGPPAGPSGRLASLGRLLLRKGRDGEEGARLNHPGLVPQVLSRPYGYNPQFAEIVGIYLQRDIPYVSWLRHLRMTYYENLGIQTWSLSNPYKSPLSAISVAPAAPEDAAQGSPVPWFTSGVETQDFPWVALDKSYQWRFFKQTVRVLRARGNGVFVLLGPFNTHLMTAGSAQRYDQLRGEMEGWLKAQGIPYSAPAPLASELYADASHPLEKGYAQLAQELLASRAFRVWLAEVRIREKHTRSWAAPTHLAESPRASEALRQGNGAM
jgi:hypothetical protein